MKKIFLITMLGIISASCTKNENFREKFKPTYKEEREEEKVVPTQEEKARDEAKKG